jgi:hypothetical protein
MPVPPAAAAIARLAGSDLKAVQLLHYGPHGSFTLHLQLLSAHCYAQPATPHGSFLSPLEALVFCSNSTGSSGLTMMGAQMPWPVE